MHYMSFDDRPDFAKRLETARVLRGFKSARAAATRFNWVYDSYAQHENGTRGIARAAKKYAKAFKVSEAWLLTGEGPSPSDNENSNENSPAQLRPMGSIPILGSIRAGSWLEVDQLDSATDQEYQHIPALLDYPLDWQYAFTVEGTSLNKRAEEGDILQCVDLIKSGLDVEDNRLVIVERTKHEGSMIERTAKRVRKTSSGFELWPESTDPAHQEPIVLNGAESHEEIRIKAVVIWIMKRP